MGFLISLGEELTAGRRALVLSSISSQVRRILKASARVDFSLVPSLYAWACKDRFRERTTPERSLDFEAEIHPRCHQGTKLENN